MNRIFAPASPASFWPGLGAKIAVAMAVCLGVRVLVAQAPPAPAASPFAATVEEDANGYKRLVPYAKYYGDAKARVEYNKLLSEKVRPVIAGQKTLAENRAAFEGYYNLVYFPMLTQTNDDSLRSLSDERRQFVGQHLEQSGAKAADVHTSLINMKKNTLTSIVRDNFHPAVRYNAMLIISSLNDQEATRTVPAVPMAAALPIIFEEFKRPENSDAVRLAALLGLSWHLEGENAKPPTTPAPPWKAQVIDELLTLAETKEPPEGRTADGHTWLRRRAVEALTVACQVKADAKITEALDKLLRDESEPLALRCAVAQSLGKMSLQAPAAVDVPALAKELGYVALEACDKELTHATTQRKEESERLARLMGSYTGDLGSGGYSGEGGTMPGGGPRGTMGSPDSGGYPGGGGYTGPRPMAGTTPGMPGDSTYGGTAAMDPSLMDPKHYRFDLLRRKIRHELYCVQLGLLGGEDHPRPKPGAAAAAPKEPPAPSGQAKDKRGLFAVAKPNEKQLVNDVYYVVRDLIDVIENRATDTMQLDRELRKKMKNLENLIGKRAPAVAPSSVPNEDLPTAVSVTAPGKAAPAGKAAPGKGAAPGKALPGKAVPGKVTPTKTMPIPPKAAWNKPAGVAPNNMHGAVRR
jgi:hypothetical protein